MSAGQDCESGIALGVSLDGDRAADSAASCTEYDITYGIVACYLVSISPAPNLMVPKRIGRAVALWAGVGAIVEWYS